MKIKSLLIGMLACSAMVACTNEDEPVVNNGNENGKSYVAINIVAPSSAAGRAAVGGFEVGSATENEATSALFVFFDNANKVVESQTVNLTWTNNTSETPAVEKISEAVIVLGENAATTHAKVLAVLNTTLPSDQVKKGTDLEAVCAIAADYSSTNSFVMSNTVYFDATGEKKIASDLTAANIGSSETEAKANPIEVYVERVLARVDAEALPTTAAEGSDAETLTVNGVDVTLDQNEAATLSAKIVGYKLYSTANTSYLFKNIPDAVNAYTWNWNDAANKRSYWANIPANMEYNTAIAYEDITHLGENVTKYTEYTQENTGSKTDNVTTDKATKLLVAAEIQKTVDGTTTPAGTIVLYKGMYMTDKGFLKLVNASLQGYTYTYVNDGGQTVTSNDWSDYIKIGKSNEENAKAWDIEAVLDVTTEKPFPTTASVPQTTIETALNNLGTAWCWKDGKSYFYVDIEHFGTAPENIGVIRNHIYKLQITSIKGLGTPVFDPSEDIVPQPTPNEPKSYVAARINILKWKVVNQTVELGK